MQAQQQLTLPAERPGFGSIGLTPFLRLRTNVFKVEVHESIKTWYKYQVSITPVSTRTTALPAPIPLKKDLRRVWEALQASEDARFTNYFEGMIPAFDGRFAAYFAAPLRQQLANVEVRLPIEQGGGFFVVSIINPIPLELDELRKWYNSTHLDANESEVLGSLAALNTIFHHSFASLYPSKKSTYYINEPSLLRGDTDALRGKPVTLGLNGGIELWRGFFQSVRPVPQTLSLNLDTTTGAFVKAGSMLDVLLSFIGRSNKRDAFASNVRPMDLIKFNRLIKGVSLNIDCGSNLPVKKGIKVKVGLSKGSARTETFEVRDTGARISVEQYFKNTFNLHLEYPELPCVIVKQGVLYPVELCTIRPGTASNRRLDSAQQLAATAFQTLAPRERLEAITNVFRNTVTRVSDARLANEFSVMFPDPRGDANKARGRLLAPPQIAYERSSQQVSRGEWRMGNNDRFLRGANLTSFAIVAVNIRNPRDIVDGFTGLFRECTRRGMHIAALPRDPLSIVYNKQRNESVDIAFKRAIELAGNAFKLKPDIVFWIMPSKSEFDYAPFKACGALYGIQTQALVASNLKKMSNNLQYQLNLSMKINVKLRGANFGFVPSSTSGVAGQRDGWLDSNDVMIFGADLSHSQDKPSVAAVVATMDKALMVYEEAISVQPLVEPANVDGKAKKSEIIGDMKEMVKKLLSRFTKVNQRPPPASILFYRDGVSDSEWASVINREIPLVERAIAEFRAGDVRLASWTPKITFVVATKGHHVRFFGTDSQSSSQFLASQEGKNGNIPAGTVVDTQVVDPRSFDWYSAAHTGILGTTRPTRYIVMVDNQVPKMSADDLQSVTNALCHGYQRCNRAVSIPAPVYYADLLCSKVAGWMAELSDGSQSGISSIPDAASRAADLAAHRDILRSKTVGRDLMRGALWWI